MKHIPKFFEPEELFSMETVKQHTYQGKIRNSIWRLIDSRVTWTADQLRKRFGPLTVNNYIYGGGSQYRGLRPAVELIDWIEYKKTGRLKTTFSSFTSQHCFGRALDISSKTISADEMVRDIKKNPEREEYRYITGVEEGVPWLHFDVRNLDSNQRILFFKP